MRKFLGKIYRKLLPSRVQVFLDCKRAERSWIEKKVIFVHVPKSAGMSISNSIYGRPLGHIKARDIKRCSVGAYDICFKFAFVRDPIARYLSAWKFMQNNFSELKGGPGLPAESFLALGAVDFAEKWLANKDVSKLNYIFQEQSSFVLGENGDVLVDYLARFDDFDNEIEILSNKVPGVKSVKKINASGSESLKVDSAALESILRKVYWRDYELLSKFS